MHLLGSIRKNKNDAFASANLGYGKMLFSQRE
jgi:hypothetical protein